MTTETSIQSIILDKRYYTLKSAIAFIERNGFHIDYGIDEKPKTYRFRQYYPTKRKKYRLKNVKPGVQFVIGMDI